MGAPGSGMEPGGALVPGSGSTSFPGSALTTFHIPAAAGAFIMLGVENMPPPLQVHLQNKDIESDLKSIYKYVPPPRASAHAPAAAHPCFSVHPALRTASLFTETGGPLHNDGVRVSPMRSCLHVWSATSCTTGTSHS
ncbi:hypothetical protein EON66_11720 [archaeon]|nr:MAG: hypothetical protein EON66_11720 [archaeon]